jgi:hypothetical protein
MIFITSVLIEILQYVFNKGVSDAGDVLLNFIGGIIGILLFKVSLKLVLQFNKSSKISVITTCYNREKTIASAIESTLSQDYANKELVVIDGASKDGSVKIINQYKNELAYFVSEKDSGMYNALNKGIQNCTGDIIGLLHSDDIFYNEKTLSKIAEAFEKTNADIIYANHKRIIIKAESIPNLLLILIFSFALILQSSKTSFGISFMEIVIIIGRIIKSSK